MVFIKAHFGWPALASITLATVLCAGAVPSGAEGPVDHVVLLDQHGKGDSLEAHRGRLVVALVVQARRLRQLKGWEMQIREALEDPEAVHFLRVADIRPGRGTTRASVLAKLEGRVPPDVSILIDLAGEWREGFGLDTSKPNVLLFDVDGRLVHRILGPVSPSVAEELAARMAGLAERAMKGAP
jgi:hypothetical protein